MSRMYLLVNNGLKMGKGKIAAQVGHAVSEVTEQMIRKHPMQWAQYKNQGHAKIVLRADESLLRELLARYAIDQSPLWCVGVVDAGRTQINPGSLTVIGFCPCEKESAPSEIASLKLL